MATVVAATIPLISLEAVAFDCETTGLDTRKARMIQLGGVRIRRASVDIDQSFQKMINPGIPIPAQSRAIHGISDADVADAQEFGEVFDAFNQWRQAALLIGYASGFDLAMLRREQRLAGIDWVAPRCLDVRYLVKVLSPTLPDSSLDTIAAWLGIEIRQRHSALGDATATAQIFVALIPKLREYGIRTLAEAERACRSFSETSNRERQLGWEEVHAAVERDPASLTIDSFPYRHRLHDLMTSPPLFVGADISLTDALARLIDNQVSSLYVHAREPLDPTGIVTERDLLRRIRLDGERAFSERVGDIASYPLLSLDADAFAYRAIARMQRLGFRHLGVHDHRGQVIGALSARDLLSQRSATALLLGDDIDAAQTAAEMAAVWGNIALLAKALLSEGVDARDIAAIISRELCALTRQSCKLAELQMKSPPPCAYALLVLGSGGRGESLLAMDQDNAIIYASGEPGGVEDRWFAELGARLSDMLDAAGVPYCKGKVMASNPHWRHSLADWRNTLQTWIRRQSSDDILNCDIFFDAACVHGERDLAEDLLQQAYQLASQSSTFIKLMSINACENAPPLGLFGRFKLDQGRMDLKLGGIMPLFSTARLLAIKHNIRFDAARVQSSPQRFLAIIARQASMQPTIEKLIEAHRIIISAILRQQLADLDVGIPPSNRVAPGTLDAALCDQLNWALHQVPNLSNLIGDPLTP